MTDQPFIIYKSSAGSGKTYTLAMEYLKLALREPTAFRRILAVTFTNKATQEMKERILNELSRLRHEVKPSEKMDQELMQFLGVEEEALKARANACLSAILHDYSRLSVSTIDSFFQKVVRAFAREMDLNAKFEVEMDQHAVMEKIVERVVAKVRDDKFLHKWLVDYAIQQIQEGKSWDIRSKIRELGMQLFQENFKKYSVEVKQFLEDSVAIENLQQFVETQKGELVKICKTYKLEANRIRQEQGIEWTDFTGASRSFARKFDQLGEKHLPVPEITGTMQKAIGDPTCWYKKGSPYQTQIETCYHAGLNAILEGLDQLNRKWNTLNGVSKNLFVFGVFRNLLEELTLLKEEENMLLISDSNEFLKEITRENEAPFIYEKVGNQYRHYLIDEFQDTSGIQWASFKPLLENSLAQSNTNLLVGDVKQSIYRWRGGEMRLLLEQVEAEVGSDRVKSKNLDTNFRSLPNIINFNNALFDTLPRVFSAVLEDRFCVSDASILSRAYADVAQKVAPHKATQSFQGKVKIDFLETDSEDEGFTDQVMANIPQMVMTLQDQGYALRDIAFLVRTKKEGENIADTLMHHAHEFPESGYRFDVLSDESMFLHKSASVKALLAGLGYLYNPSEEVQFRTMWYYYALIHTLPISHKLFEVNTYPEFLVDKVKHFDTRLNDLLQLPLMEMVEELTVLLGLDITEKEKAYLSGFKEAVFDFMANNRSDLSEFLDWWEINKDKRTVKIPDGHDAMRILTIHKSKGLQFKVVLMPFLKWSIFDLKHAPIVWSPFRMANHEAILPLSLHKDLAQSDFQDTYSEEAVMAYLDSLNMIYVALTRAEEVFWGLVPYKKIKNDTSRNNIEVHFQEILTAPFNITTDFHEDLFNPETKVFELGDWPNKEKKEALSPALPDLRWKYTNWTKLLQVKKYATDFSQEGLEQRKKQQYGLLIHELLEKSKVKRDVYLTLQDFNFEGRLTATEKEVVTQQLDHLFADPRFHAWFDDTGILLSEQGIILPGGKQKRPDRVLLKSDSAVVVDFKTGEKNTRYTLQVKEYMELVSKLTGKPASGYLCYLETGEIEEIYA